jgi:hypothetical protein
MPIIDKIHPIFLHKRLIPHESSSIPMEYSDFTSLHVLVIYETIRNIIPPNKKPTYIFFVILVIAIYLK